MAERQITFGALTSCDVTSLRRTRFSLRSRPSGRSAPSVVTATAVTRSPSEIRRKSWISSAAKNTRLANSPASSAGRGLSSGITCSDISCPSLFDDAPGTPMRLAMTLRWMSEVPP